jgi:ABC-type multidrug transport system fused ATPase/permease subunit
LSTIRNADQILVLDKGQIVEQGKHHELMQLEHGIYKTLSGLQVLN